MPGTLGYAVRTIIKHPKGTNSLLYRAASGHYRLGDTDFSIRWNLIKGHFSRAIPQGERQHLAGTNPENAVYGNAGSGRICDATKTNVTIIRIIFIGIPSNMAVYNEWLTGHNQVFTDLWSRVFTRLTGDIPEISVFMQTNDLNDAPPVVGTSYGPTFPVQPGFSLSIWRMGSEFVNKCTFVILLFSMLCYSICTRNQEGESHASIY